MKKYSIQVVSSAPPAIIKRTFVCDQIGNFVRTVCRYKNKCFLVHGTEDGVPWIDSRETLTWKV